MIAVAYDTGIQLSWPYLGGEWIGFGPRFKLGFEYRDQPPDEGIGGFGGIGVELGVWLADRVQLVGIADRESGLYSGTRDQLSIALRIGLRHVGLGK